MAGARSAALQGLRVVDLTRVLAGPLCTQILADQGAEVTKIEPPAGDETRRLGPPYTPSQQSAYFAALNRGKQSICLDLSSPEGQQVLHGLLSQADVLVENFVPGTLERWGLGYEDVLAARYPRLILCSISGFGADGPLGGLPGYDAVLQAACGIMSVNGSADSGATKVGIPVVDHLTGYVALSGILMALQARARDGLGQHVEATLYDTAISLLLPHGANWLCSGELPAPLGSAVFLWIKGGWCPTTSSRQPTGRCSSASSTRGSSRAFARRSGGRSWRRTRASSTTRSAWPTGRRCMRRSGRPLRRTRRSGGPTR
jgi:crotonobetainyl-CoA:carnitine CoA-transferase CaiB-like acyl-CoA transferase